MEVERQRGRRCAFCGAVSLTKEHVWPRWMSKYFADIAGSELSGWIGADEGDLVTYDPPGPVPGRAVGNTLRRVGAGGAFNLTTRSVCGGCNGGWMARLEAEVEHVLGPMLSGNPSLLCDRRAECLATWATKTALVATLAWDGSLPPDPFRELYRDQGPSESTTVWCAYRPQFAVAHYHQPLQSRTAEPSGFPDGFVATMLLGHAVVCIESHFAGCPPRNVVTNLTYEVRVWPPQSPTASCTWPPPSAVPDERIARWIQPPNERIAMPR